jgi:hypothetical protein
MQRTYGIELEANAFLAPAIFNIELKPKGYWLPYDNPQYDGKNKLISRENKGDLIFSLVYFPPENSFEVIVSPTEDLSLLDSMVEASYQMMLGKVKNLAYCPRIYPPFLVSNEQILLGLYKFDISFSVTPKEMGFKSLHEISEAREGKDYIFLGDLLEAPLTAGEKIYMEMSEFVEQNCGYVLFADLRIRNSVLLLHLSFTPLEVHRYQEIDTMKITEICKRLHEILERKEE